MTQESSLRDTADRQTRWLFRSEVIGNLQSMPRRPAKRLVPQQRRLPNFCGGPLLPRGLVAPTKQEPILRAFSLEADEGVFAS